MAVEGEREMTSLRRLENQKARELSSLIGGKQSERWADSHRNEQRDRGR